MRASDSYKQSSLSGPHEQPCTSSYSGNSGHLEGQSCGLVSPRSFQRTSVSCENTTAHPDLPLMLCLAEGNSPRAFSLANIPQPSSLQKTSRQLTSTGAVGGDGAGITSVHCLPETLPLSKTKDQA